MAELNFCPNCNASDFKLILCKENVFFCKECNNFFKFEDLSIKCPKCDKTEIRKSDFPGPDGSVIFQCNTCKKTFSAPEILKHNKIK